jgi:hypothetical protein
MDIERSAINPAEAVGMGKYGKKIFNLIEIEELDNFVENFEPKFTESEGQ